MMKRRDFLKNASGLTAAVGLAKPTAAIAAELADDQICKQPSFPQAENLTAHVAEFVVSTKLSTIPAETIELGKKSVLDCLGLALSGSKAETAGLVQKYVESLGCGV